MKLLKALALPRGRVIIRAIDHRVQVRDLDIEAGWEAAEVVAAPGLSRKKPE